MIHVLKNDLRSYVPHRSQTVGYLIAMGRNEVKQD